MAKSTTKTAAQRVTAAEKRAMAMKLRESGLTFDRIGEAIGCSTSRAHQYVAEQLEKLAKQSDEATESLRQMELERLDRMLTACWWMAEAGDLKAIDRVLKLSERRAKLMGLDAPTKVAPTNPDGDGPYAPPSTEAETDARIAELLAKQGQ